MSKREEKVSKVEEAMREPVYTEEQMLAIVNATNRKICYYPEVAEVLGVNVAIFLGQMEWRWQQNGKKDFYKYIDECKSCREGDSWAAELGLTRHAIDSALDVIGTRIRGEQRAKNLLDSGTELNHIVICYMPSKGALQWFFNEKLFLRLRAKLLAMRGSAISKTSETAYFENLQNGLFEKNGNTYSELTQNQQYSSLENQDTESYLASEEDPQVQSSEKIREKNKTRAARGRRQLTDKQRKLIEDEKKSTTMALDFSVSPSTMALAIEKYGDEDWVRGEELKFINHYTNKNPTFKVKDWNRQFLYGWLVDAHRIKKDNEKKYGKPTDGKSANSYRLEQIKNLATTDIFGDADPKELARRLYEKRYGRNEDTADA